MCWWSVKPILSIKIVISIISKLCATVQCKIFKGYKFRGFTVSLQNTKIISTKMNRQLVTWLNYACNPRILLSTNQNFNKSAKFIAHEIFELYGIFHSKNERSLSYIITLLDNN